MSSRATPTLVHERFLNATVRITEDAVYRTFALETVVLNVKRGTYHGLNHTAARMLVVLDGSDDVRTAIADLSDEYGIPAEQIARDVEELCGRLLERGLIEVSYERPIE